VLALKRLAESSPCIFGGHVPNCNALLRPSGGHYFILVVGGFRAIGRICYAPHRIRHTCCGLHLVESAVNGSFTNYIRMQFSGFLGARQGVFGPFGLILISDPPGLSLPFLDSDPCAEGGLFISARVFFPV
jgi:hypothetical protein